jgi:hypothetical protein
MTKRTIVRLLHAPFDASGTRSRSRPVDEGWGRQAGRRVLGDESHSHGGRYRAALALRSRCARAAPSSSESARSPRTRTTTYGVGSLAEECRRRSRRGRRGRGRGRGRARARRRQRRRKGGPHARARGADGARDGGGGGDDDGGARDGGDDDDGSAAVWSKPAKAMPYFLDRHRTRCGRLARRRARELGGDARARRRAAVDRTPLAPLAPVASSRPRARCRS